MNERSFTVNGVKIVRITKAKARKIYDAGKNLYMYPVNAWPESPWYGAWIVNNRQGRQLSFDQLINEFIYYNCDYERGYYPAFYIEERN